MVCQQANESDKLFLYCTRLESWSAFTRISVIAGIILIAYGKKSISRFDKKILKSTRYKKKIEILGVSIIFKPWLH